MRRPRPSKADQEAALIFSVALVGGAVLLALGLMVGLPLGIILLMRRSERAAQERARREGVRCQVVVKTFRRVSMTQHRVLFLIYLPTGPIGREYLLAGLGDNDLANWAALGVPLWAHVTPDAETIALDAAG
jgi:hypothetical protein